MGYAKRGGSAAPFSLFQLAIRVTSRLRHSISSREIAKRIPLFQPADMKRFDLEIFFYPELRSFTPQSRLLYTAERRNLG
jgi:hypothetical protein